MTIQEYTPVSSLQRDYLGAIKKTEKGPVILANYAKPVAVLLSPEEYNKLVEDAQDAKRYRRLQYASEIAKRMDAGDYVELSPTEILALAD